MIRLTQAIGSKHKGGAQRFFLRLVDALARAGVEQSIVVKQGGWTEKQLQSAAMPVFPLNFGGALDLTTGSGFRRVLTSSNSAIVMTWLERATQRTPKGPWVHIGRLGGYYDLKDYQRCDHLVGNTPDIVDYIRRGGWPDDKVSHVPNFAPFKNETPLSRLDYTTPADVPLILWLGRMEHKKGPDIVIRALGSIPEAYLWLAGDGEFEAECRKLAAETGVLDRVRFLGWRDDIHALLETADLFVCASRHEPLGNIILEAWAHGRPIVSARSPGPEHLIEDGKTGFLVANDNPEAMAAALNRMIANPALTAQIGAAGRAHFESTYSEDAVVTMYLELFQRLIAQGKRGAA